MRATAATMRTELRADDLQRKLKGLPVHVQQAILKKGMRRALAPLQKQLKSSWLSAPYKGKAPHRQSIARSTVVDVRRKGNKDAKLVTGKVGVDYKSKRGMLQRIFHLLEGGFKRYHKGSKGSKAAYGNFSASAHDQKRSYTAYLREARKRVLQTKGMKRHERGAMLKAVAEEARRQFPLYVGERTERQRGRKRSIQANNAYTTGSWRSKAIVKSQLAGIASIVRTESLRAADEALRKTA